MIPILSCINVSKMYRTGLGHRAVQAVRNLSLQIDIAETVGLIGTNGAGKTTTIKMIMGLVHQSAGTIQINGVDSRDPRSRRGTSFMPEVPCLYENLTVHETLAYVQALEGGGAGTIEDVSGMLGLDLLRTRLVGALSKGNRQRLSLAQALVGRPKFLVLDEPMSGMDPPGRELFRSVFKRLHDTGTCIVFSTHILEDVERLCSRVVMLDSGDVKYDGPVEELLERGAGGTRIVVSRLEPELRSTVESLAMGAIEAGLDGTDAVIVPAGEEPRKVLAVLAAAGVYPRMVEPNRLPLGQLLYGTAVKTEAQ